MTYMLNPIQEIASVEPTDEPVEVLASHDDLAPSMLPSAVDYISFKEKGSLSEGKPGRRLPQTSHMIFDFVDLR